MSFSCRGVPRCQHIKVNGTQCDSPALRQQKFCFFHNRWRETRIVINANRARRARPSLDLPILEDANSVQLALMQVLGLLLRNQIDHKTAALAFYGLQTASSNLNQADFRPFAQHVVIDPEKAGESRLGEYIWEPETVNRPAVTPSPATAPSHSALPKVAEHAARAGPSTHAEDFRKAVARALERLAPEEQRRIMSGNGHKHTAPSLPAG
jgi:hypothetical protein